MSGRPKENSTENFWNSVEKHAYCWTWIGARNKAGYGAAWFEGKLWRAHRLSYFLHHGNIDDDLMILHSCDKPWCVNPDHLRQGTASDNSRDAVERNRVRIVRPRAAFINTDASHLKRNPSMIRKTRRI